MTFKELIQHLEQEIKKREVLLETAMNPSNFKGPHLQIYARRLADNTLNEAKHRLTLIKYFLEESKIEINTDTGGLEEYLFLGRRV